MHRARGSREGTAPGGGVGKERAGEGGKGELWVFLGNRCKTSVFKLRLLFAHSATVVTGELIPGFPSQGKRGEKEKFALQNFPGFFSIFVKD